MQPRRNEIVALTRGDARVGSHKVVGRVMRRIDNEHVEVCFTDELRTVADATLERIRYTGRLDAGSWGGRVRHPAFIPFPSMRRMKARARMDARHRDARSAMR